ncbi:MAG: rane fusion protein multidrug efflux system [Thermodesulfobacteriota bacterium]|nr:rane fusion protein multidrug efflux system [Thermodesulfobacteriota bacterium]
MQSRSWVLVQIFVGLLSVCLFACEKTPRKQVRIPEVSVAHPVEQEITRYLEYTGNTVALEYVDIRARVAGFLKKINFDPQAQVKAGQILFLIDPRQYQAQLDEAKAKLEATKAQYELAKINEELAKALEAKEAVSWLRMQEAIAKSGVSKADVDLAQAAVDKARLDLEYSQVASPIDGRVSRNLVDVGNLVGATEKTLLTTVVNDEFVYCYFNLSELDLLAARRAHAAAVASTIRSHNIPAYLGLADEPGFPHEGFVDFVDTKLNPATGTIQVRGVFSNTDRLLLSGMFARVRLPLGTQKSLLIPDTAVQFDRDGRSVLVVNPDNVVEQKRIKIGQDVEGMRVVEEGLKSTDRVIVEGTQRARPGSKVNPELLPAAPQKNDSGSPAKTRDK